MKRALKQLLLAHEGKVNHAYQDHLGYWTIGVGRLIDERKGGGLSDAEIDYLLENDIDRVVEQLELTLSFWDDLPENVQLALSCMAFQLGIAGLYGFKKMLVAIENKDWAEARREALHSKWAHQTPSRASEIAEMLHG